MRLTGWISGAGYDRENRRQITITVNEDCFEELDTLVEKRLDIEINEQAKKRSLTANNYMWALCTEIADKVGIGKDDVYRQAIIERGIYKDFHNLTDDEIKTLAVAWSLLGTGWITEPLDYEPDGEHQILRCYYGTSKYNAKQIHRVIEWLEEDAKSVGISIMDDKEKSLLLTQWNELRKRATK